MALVASLAVGAGPAQGQSLAELAKKEDARRKALQASSKVITNKDLPPVQTKTPMGQAAPEAGGPAAGTGGAAPGGGPTPAGSSAQGSVPEAGRAPGQPAQPAEPEDPKKDEQYWRQRITEARQKLARNEILLAALEGRVNGLMAEFVSRDDPAQKAVIAQDRQQAINELNRTRAETERLKQEIADIQEEARKAGVPPGWLR